VVVDSIRVYNLRNFPVVQELVRDTDFTVEVNGNLTSIRLLYPVPTNPADPVLPGDQLKVTYDVQVDAKLESESRGTGFGASVGYGWIGVSYNHQQSTSQVLSGEAIFLFDRTQVDSMNVTMNGSWRGFATSALASHTRSSSSRFDLEETDNTSRLSLQGSGRLYGMDARATANVERYRGTSTGFDMRMINASLFWRPYGNWQASFNATASNSQYLNPVRQTTFLSAQASLYWNPDSGWRHQAFAQIEREDSGSSAVSTLMKLGAQTQRQLGKLTFNANASLGYIQSSGSSGLSESIGFNIRRAL